MMSRAAYQAAVDQLPTLPRLVFILHRADALSYPDIGVRLSISSDAVESCIAEALYMLDRILDGEVPIRRKNDHIAVAEADLLRRYRVYCDEARVGDWSIYNPGAGAGRVTSRNVAVQIAGPLRAWMKIVRHRMGEAIGIGGASMTFEHWLWAQAEER